MANKKRVVFKNLWNEYTEENEVIAVFVDTPWNDKEVTTYMHIGQHSGADRQYMKELEDAEYAEYRSLYDELVNIGYENLKVLNPDWEKFYQEVA